MRIRRSCVSDAEIRFATTEKAKWERDVLQPLRAYTIDATVHTENRIDDTENRIDDTENRMLPYADGKIAHHIKTYPIILSVIFSIV